MRAHGLNHGGGRQAERHHQKRDEQHNEQDHRQHLFHQQHQHDRKRCRHRAAGLERVAAHPQKLPDAIHVDILLFAEGDVHDRTEHNRQQRRADKAGRDVPPTVEEQNVAPQQQCGRDEVIAPAKERPHSFAG